MTAPEGHAKAPLWHGMIRIAMGISLGLILTLTLSVLNGAKPRSVDLATLDPAFAVMRGQGAADAVAGQAQTQMQTLLKRAKDNPGNADIALAVAREVIRQGRAAGDARLVGAGQAVLLPYLPLENPEVLLVSATAAQYRHDFSTAKALLARAVVADPRSLQGWLTLATVQLVTGDVADAITTCRKLFDLGRDDIGFLCIASASTLRPEAAELRRRLDQAIAAKAFAPDLQGWALGLAGEYARLAGDSAAAITAFEQVVANDPLALRDRLMLVDLEIERGQTKTALALLQQAAPVDGARIRRAYLRGLDGQPDEVAQEMDALAAELAANLALGNNSHAREEALFSLLLTGDAGMALERALANWDLQKEYDDARLLLAAAQAAGKPEAAAGVTAWLTLEGLVLPGLNRPWGAIE